ncbi:HAD-IIB family hydrolase [Thalassotalea euphylliae]|uniref:HAD-IIB family hydrolase n=1 Tax=Thalassotalea euphylliae TaxID=1655234 RepID=UPI003643CEC5
MIQHPIIFTDLDGTLLDHYTYSFEAALPVIAQLKVNDIPVVATTSKTVQEVINIYEAIGINGPFIVENGAAVYLPKQLFNKQPQDTTEQPHFWVKSFSRSRETFINVVEQLSNSFGEKFRSFYQMTSADIAEVTGLTVPQAKLASQRQFGEPVLWLGTDKEKHQFVASAKALGANVLLGGRFIHICDACDKGKALNWLAGEYQHLLKLPYVTAIALGDSGNDIAMLEAADIAVQIKSPTHSFPRLDTDRTRFIFQTKGYGPVGWAESLNFILNFPLLGGHSHG